jgi:rhamnose utilization protein RhaD (predicted bifunctional aldolase and dehydrogenase)
MKSMQWIAISLLGLLASGALTPLPAANEARQAYDKMVEESVKEADEYQQEEESKKKAAEAETRTQQEVAMDERVKAERKRIGAEMDAIRNRGIGSGFTQGMKDNLLKQQQDKLDQLTSDPEAYFQRQ